MPKRMKYMAAAAALAVAAPVAFFSADQFLGAADHLDPPARTDPNVDPTPDKAADIADIYAYHTDTSIIIALTFAGPQPTNLPATYDRNVLYTINISNAGARTDAEFPVRIRFGFDGSAPGVQVTGLPGTTGPITGPVETTLTRDGVRVRAGLYDDPFFFDLQGFNQTRSTGTLAITNTRDFFAGQNITGVVIEIPRAAVVSGANPIDIWATSARFGGQL